VRRPRPTLWLIASATALLIAANTSVYGMLLATAMGIGLISDMWIRRRGLRAISLRRAAIGLGIWVGGLMVCGLLLGRYAMTDTQFMSLINLNPWQAPPLLGNFVDGLVHLPNFFTQAFWSNSLIRLADGPYAVNLLAGIALVWAGAIALGLWRRPAAAVAFVVGLGLMFVFAMAIYRGYYVRHLGHYFILTVSCLWLYGVSSDSGSVGLGLLRKLHSDRAVRRASLAWTVLLAWSAAIGVTAWAYDLKWRFADAQAVAQEIRAQDPTGEAVVITTTRTPGSAVAAELHRPIYFTGIADWAGAIDWDLWLTQEQDRTIDEALGLLRLPNQNGSPHPPIFLVTGPDMPPPGRQYKLEPLWQDTPPIVQVDQLRLYRLIIAPEFKPAQ
jgi:hypothetical protein